MAINRTFNAIWAEISAWGSLIKTGTTQYVPSPGTLTTTDSAGNSVLNGANNQAAYAIASTSPFTPVDANGQSADLPLTSSLGDAGTANMTPLDENSGKYQVIRQYGDIYMYNDGNIIMWGGNGKNFNFGNGYEENHGWANQACVYNNENFTIPLLALSLYANGGNSPPSGANLPSADQSDWEWLGGMVSKSWGIEYNFAYGASYEWNGGPSNYMDAYGNVGALLTDVMQGKHCTFSYGTGYEESLVAWGNDCTWVHADDAGSPYTGRKYDSWQSSYLSLETVAASFSTSPLAQPPGGLFSQLAAADPLLEAAMDETSNPTDFASRNTWTAANLLVSKTFGNTYEYHNGPGLSVQEGASEERVYGNSYSTVVGNSTESVTGNSSTTVTGNSSETVTGNATAMIQGNSTEQFWGGKAEFFMGGKSEMILGAADEITLSVKMELKTLGAIEVFGGLSIATFMGLLIETELGGKISVGGFKFDQAVMEVKTRDTIKAGVHGAALVQSSPINVNTP